MLYFCLIRWKVWCYITLRKYAYPFLCWCCAVCAMKDIIHRCFMSGLSIVCWGINKLWLYDITIFSHSWDWKGFCLGWFLQLLNSEFDFDPQITSFKPFKPVGLTEMAKLNKRLSATCLKLIWFSYIKEKKNLQGPQDQLMVRLVTWAKSFTFFEWILQYWCGLMMWSYDVVLSLMHLPQKHWLPKNFWYRLVTWNVPP